jgi:hypothetical protein
MTARSVNKLPAANGETVPRLQAGPDRACRHLGRLSAGLRGDPRFANVADDRGRYIIGAPKSELKKFGTELARPDGWRRVQDGVEVKLTRHPETDETVILWRTAQQ